MSASPNAHIKVYYRAVAARIMQYCCRERKYDQHERLKNPEKYPHVCANLSYKAAISLKKTVCLGLVSHVAKEKISLPHTIPER